MNTGAPSASGGSQGNIPAAGLLASIFENSEIAIISKQLDGIVTSWNPAAERLFGFGADEMVGQSIRSLIPEERQHEEDEIIAGVVAGERSGVTETYRLHKDGHQIRVALNVSPVRDAEGAIVGASQMVRGLDALDAANRALADSERRFQMMADNIAQLAWMADAEGSIFWYNKRWFDYTGTTLEDMRGWGWKSVHHPDHVERVVKRLQHSWDTGEIWEDTFPLRSAEGEYRWFLSRARPIYDENGTIACWFGTNTDITEQREQRHAIEDLLREVNHRAKNMLTLIQALARRSAPGNEAFVKRFVRRIQALAANQDLLVERAWSGVKIADLIDAQLDFASDRAGKRLHRSGPDFEISARTAETLGMALHELATNALKYGALSTDQGMVDIVWTVENGQFSIRWEERGGPPVEEPQRTGFGTSVIRDMPSASLDAEVAFEYRPTGVFWSLATAVGKVAES
ncbi:sensor histidine kinase [Croceicoccus mobilis]|nr:PAS domain S-box protein [Croceicoccus mobilis]